ncbi:MAG: FAD-dependent oxidoreductase [Verrucomicrobiales bacterium]
MGTAADQQRDVIVFGGGVAGLWILNALAAKGYDALLMTDRELGAGQTLAAQGVIHGGLKYALGQTVGQFRSPQGHARPLAGLPRWPGRD